MPIIDSGIYNALMQPQKSAFDYAEQYAAADDRKTQRAMNALQMQQLQQGIADDNALRAYMKQSPNLADAGVQATLYGIAPKAAGGILKDRALMDKELAQTAQAKAATAGSEFDLQRKKLDFAWQSIGAAHSPQQAQQIISDGLQRGYFTPEQAQTELQSIPQDPQQYQQWRQQKMLSILSVKDQFEQQWKQRDFGLKSNNELIGPDGQVNKTLLDAKKQIANAGKTSVGVNTEKSLLGTVADNVGKDIVATSEGARSAQNTLSAVARIREALASGKAITGVGANQRVLLGQLGETMGLGSAANQETLAKTRDAIHGLSQLELEGAGSMKGQGQITEGERALLRKAASGDITMTPSELTTLMNTFERTANYRIGRNKSNVATLKNMPNASSVVPFLESNGQSNEDFTGGLSAAIAAEAARRAKAKGGK